VRIILATTAAEPGGVWRHVSDLAAGFAERDIDVVVAIPSSARRLIEAADSRGLPWVALEESYGLTADVWHLHLHKTFDLPALKAQASRIARSRQLPVLTEHLPRDHFSDPANLTDPTLPPARKKPFARQLKTLIKRLQFRASSSVIAVGHPSREFLVERYGCDPKRITVIRNGVEVSGVEVADPRPSETQLKVLAVGALGWRKGFDVLSEAAALAKQPWSVTVIGEGGLLDQLIEHAARVAPGRVSFVGFDPAAASAAERHDVLCIPSRAEALPYVALEAMARARPIVASAVDGLTELVEDEVTGFLVPPGDPAQLAAALDRLAAADPETRLAMGLASRRRIEEGFRMDQMLDQTLASYAGTLR
jgi:glycosyltransferase involved in cell wall biosynthesis